MFKRLSETLAAYQARDPAARSKLEIFLLYPGVHAILFHRVSHWLYRHRLFFLARLNSQIARHITGIEIHPGARIDVLLYHGVTLGGTGKDQGKRHPTIGNGVMIACGAKVLGPFKVGDGARIASNAVVLSEIPAEATAVGVPARVVRIAGEKMNYAADVDQIHITDPVQKELQAISSRLEWLEKLMDEQAKSENL